MKRKKERYRMSAGMPELGSKISLISKADIRYEGRLFTVDPQECTIALANGKSHCTQKCPKPTSWFFCSLHLTLSLTSTERVRLPASRMKVWWQKKARSLCFVDFFFHPFEERKSSEKENGALSHTHGRRKRKNLHHSSIVPFFSSLLRRVFVKSQAWTASV